MRQLPEGRHGAQGVLPVSQGILLRPGLPESSLSDPQAELYCQDTGDVDGGCDRHGVGKCWKISYIRNDG